MGKISGKKCVGFDVGKRLGRVLNNDGGGKQDECHDGEDGKGSVWQCDVGDHNKNR